MPDENALPPGGADRVEEGGFDVVYAEPTRESDTAGELGPLDAVDLAGRQRQHPEDDDQGT